MAISKDHARVYPAEYPVVFQAVCQAATAERMSIIAADPQTGTVVLKTGVSFSTWGEDIRVQVFGSGPGSTTVAMSSSLKFGLVDWGKNAKNLDRFFTHVGSLLATAPAAAPAALPSAPPAAWAADPTGRHQLRWWDGMQWTEHYAPNPRPPVAPPLPPAPQPTPTALPAQPYVDTAVYMQPAPERPVTSPPAGCSTVMPTRCRCRC